MKTNKISTCLLTAILALLLLKAVPVAVAQQKGGTVTDIDGNVYKTVVIGAQEWMAENLRTTRFNDGTPIPVVTDMTDWVRVTTPAFCWNNNDSLKKNVYGAMYNWYAVNTGKLCPEGWRVPTDDDWKILTGFLGGDKVAGEKLKSSGSALWNVPVKKSSTDCGFMAIPAGYRYGYYWGSGIFYETGINGYFWTSTEATDTHVWSRTVSAGKSLIYRSFFTKNNGFSVRCVKCK